MTKAQQAMAFAIAYPEKRPGKKTSLETKEVNVATLSHARAVLAFSQPLAEAVMAGTEKLAVAYEQATKGKTRIDAVSKRIKKLRERG